MFLKNIILYVTSTMLLLSDSRAATASEHRPVCVYPIEQISPNETKTTTYRTVPLDVGEMDITAENFKIRMDELFSGDHHELLCPVKLEDIVFNMPLISCPEAYPAAFHNILRRLNANYTDDRAQNDLLEYVWRSRIGRKMLLRLKNVFHNEKRAKNMVKIMWFYHNEAHEMMLFPDVFFGYELHKTDYGLNQSSHERLYDNDAFRLVNEIMRKKFPYNAALVSWTGHHFRKQNSDMRFDEGTSYPLVKDSLHLAEFQVSILARKRESKLIVGTTFLYDFVVFTMCWIYRARLGTCVTPLPGNTNETVDITSIEIESYAEGTTMDDMVLQVQCVGFEISEHFEDFLEPDFAN